MTAPPPRSSVRTSSDILMADPTTTVLDLVGPSAEPARDGRPFRRGAPVRPARGR